MKTILDPSFKYTPSAETDLRKTFERIRREQRPRYRASAAAERACTSKPSQPEPSPQPYALPAASARR